MRLPNGYGGVVKLSGNRRRPYAARITTGWHINDISGKRIVTIEDGVRNGGMGSAVLEWMSDHGYQPTITRMGLPDDFVEHGTVNQLREIVHLDNNSIKETLKAVSRS